MILTVNTAIEPFSISLMTVDKQLLIQQAIKPDYEFCENMIQHINELLHKVGCAIDQLSACGVITGPGAYTGLRLGITTLKTICHVQNIPMYAISTIDAFLASIKYQQQIVLALLPARKNHWVHQLVKLDGAVEPVSNFGEVTLLELQHLVSNLNNDILIVCQANEQKVIQFLMSKNRPFLIQSVTAETVGYLVADFIAQSRDGDQLSTINPVYLHEAVKNN